MTKLVPVHHIERSIQVLRGQKVMLDVDLARVYRVPTRTLNQAVKRNRGRFPAGFMFQLAKTERDEVITRCDHLQQLRFSPNLPYAFTEHGAIMLASVLRSQIAIRASVHIVRAFIRLREVALSDKAFRHRLDALEKKYDAQFKVVFDAIRDLMEPSPGVARRRIGFRWDDEQ